MTKPLVLDTHVWLWLLSGESQLSKQSIKQIQDATKQGQAYVSAISIWEIGMFVAKNRIKLYQECLQWVQQALQAPGLNLVQLTPEIAIDSTRLPQEFHGDPADRIIVATARHLNASLLTRDKRILAYGRIGHVSVVSA